MKSTDKFLTGIVIAVVLLVGVAFAVTLLRPKPTYRSEDAPDGVAHNYLLALQQRAYERAYGYLAPTIPGHPASAQAFADDIRNNSWNFNLDVTSTTLEVESARITGDKATVTVRQTDFHQGALFESSQYTKTFEMVLRREDGGWRIVGAQSYWAPCWDEQNGCR